MKLKPIFSHVLKRSFNTLHVPKHNIITLNVAYRYKQMHQRILGIIKFLILNNYKAKRIKKAIIKQNNPIASDRANPKIA